MKWEKKGDLYLIGGHALRPVSPAELEKASYRLGDIIIDQKRSLYAEKPPLLIPLMRSGFRTAHNISTKLRMALYNAEVGHMDIEFQPIKVVNQRNGMRGNTSMAHTADLVAAGDAMKDYEEGIIVDDEFEQGMCDNIRYAVSRLSGRKILTAAPYFVTNFDADGNIVGKAPDFYVEKVDPVEIAGKTYPVRLVMSWEMDTVADPALWKQLFPELV